ncbi:E3 ubiquitin protein ligase RIE1 [Linum grandiflorum]
MSRDVPYEEEEEAESDGGGGECCCCICLMQMESDLEMLPCQHKFHKVCIERWLMRKRRKTCPLCRFSMVEDDEEEVQEYLTDDMLIWFSSFHVAGF